MSNLYKQRYFVTETDQARVINSNKVIEQKLGELRRGAEHASAGGPAAEAAFHEGITAEEVEIEPEIDYAAQAKEEAEALLEQAREEAKAILQRAEQEAEELKHQAHSEGRQEGYQEGSEMAKAELDQQLLELKSQERRLQKDYQKQLEGLEPRLLDVVLQVVEKVFQIQFADKKDILLYLITKTINGIEGCKQFQIRVGQENYQFLNSQREAIMGRIGADMSIEVIADYSVRENQCMIETDIGIFSCGLGTQLENLIKDLRSLCS